MSEDVRWKQRFSNCTKAVNQLTEFIDKGELNKFEVQGLIKCFEYTFELAWKTLKDYLEDQGLDANSPRTAIQVAFQTQLIQDGHVWIDALEKRNLMTHTYDEKLAKEAEMLIKNNYYQMIIKLYKTLEGLV